MGVWAYPMVVNESTLGTPSDLHPVFRTLDMRRLTQSAIHARCALSDVHSVRLHGGYCSRHCLVSSPLLYSRFSLSKRVAALQAATSCETVGYTVRIERLRLEPYRGTISVYVET